MKNSVILFALAALFTCCKKQPVPEPTYALEISLDGTLYDARVQSTAGEPGIIYVNKTGLTGKNTITVKPKNAEPVTFYYTTSGTLRVTVKIDGKQTVDQWQPGGSHLFYFKKGN